jgi:uncharacterized protein
MTGIIEIKKLLKEMKPVLDRTDYVFCTKECFYINEEIISLSPIATILEPEGMTLVVSKMKADKHKLSYDTIFHKITLEVHSSLEAVGLTAAISTALASRNIPANVVAGYYHDHTFIPRDKADIALETLEGITR